MKLLPQWQPLSSYDAQLSLKTHKLIQTQVKQETKQLQLIYFSNIKKYAFSIKTKGFFISEDNNSFVFKIYIFIGSIFYHYQHHKENRQNFTHSRQNTIIFLCTSLN